MTVSYPSEIRFKVPDSITVAGLGVYGIVLNQRNLVIDYTAGKNFRGYIKFIVTGDWDADQKTLTTKAEKKGFDGENIDLLIKGIGQIYSGEGIDVIASIRERLKREVEAQKRSQVTAADAEGNNKKPHVN